MTTVRNVAIVLGLAAALWLLPGVDDAAAVLGSALTAGFLLAIALILVRVYREHRMTIHGLGDRHRAILYAALAAIIFAGAGAGRLLDTGPGIALWFLVVGLAVLGLVAVWRHWREYA